MKSTNRDIIQWIEIDRGALVHNLRQFRSLIGQDRTLMAVVKANAYGHGLREVSEIVLSAGADWLGVNSVEEGINLREAGFDAPILVLGAALRGDLEKAFRHDLRLTVYNTETIDALGRLAAKLKKRVRVHLKVETGTYRQGLRAEDLVRFVRRIQKHPGLVLEGLSSHFANIEDTTSSAYPDLQLKAFLAAVDRLGRERIEIPVKHMSCTASSILFPSTHFDMARVGIGLYGLWPSKETLLSCRLQKREPIELRPVLSWRARIAQVKQVPKGSFIGYGGTFRTTRAARLAVIPVGYYDGYDRGLSNSAYVLVRGRRAALRGRVAMDFITADVTDIPGARLEDEVTLIGGNGREVITAEFLASLAGTISYEILARLNPQIPRIVI
ncbi:MAG: alanine racemase [Candidatus Aminicenantes bacterium]|nr:alanine racemase [Candidatus Aminicenantes bacterium]